MNNMKNTANCCRYINNNYCSNFSNGFRCCCEHVDEAYTCKFQCSKPITWDQFSGWSADEVEEYFKEV